MDKALILAKKLQELAQRGEGGEKHNAARLLQRLMKRHGLTEADLNSLDETYHEFKVPASLQSLFHQICASILGSKIYHANAYSRKGKKTILVVKTTSLFALEIRAQFNFYSAKLLEEQKVLLHAFIIKNHIFPNDTERREPSKQEIEDARRAREMAAAIESAGYLKQISNG